MFGGNRYVSKWLWDTSSWWSQTASSPVNPGTLRGMTGLYSSSVTSATTDPSVVTDVTTLRCKCTPTPLSHTPTVTENTADLPGMLSTDGARDCSPASRCHGRP